MAHTEVPTILWVDDQPDDALFQRLTLDGYSVISVRTGAAALELAANATHALIVVDLHLPDIHGLTVLDRIQRRGIGTPTVAIAGRLLAPEIEGYARAVGAHAFRYKPIVPEDFTQFLRCIGGGAATAASASSISSDIGPHSWLMNRLPGKHSALTVLVIQLETVIAMNADPLEEQRAQSAMLHALLSLLADPTLPFESFEPCADALRITLDVSVESSIGSRATCARNVLVDKARPPLVLRDTRIRRALDLLFQKPRWCREEELAVAAAVSRSRFARLVYHETSIDYRVLRRQVVMKAGVADVLSTTEQIAQIAHRLEMPPGTFDRLFREAFSCPPRELRRLWQCLGQKHATGELSSRLIGPIDELR